MNSSASATTAAPCSLVYLDLGTNIGDSITDFVKRRPEKRLHETLRVAVGNGWKPSTTCAYGFEPNPHHTRRLRELRERLAPRFASLAILTETAVGGPEQHAQPLWIIPGNHSRMVGATLTSNPRPAERPSARPISTVVLSRWLRDVIANGREEDQDDDVK